MFILRNQKNLNLILEIGLVEIRRSIELFNIHNLMLKNLWIIWNGFHLQTLAMLNSLLRVALDVLNQQFETLAHDRPINHFKKVEKE